MWRSGDIELFATLFYSLLFSESNLSEPKGKGDNTAQRGKEQRW